MKNKVKVVTTWSDSGYEEYGQYWCKAVERYLPVDWVIKIYGSKKLEKFNWLDWDNEFPNWKEYQKNIAKEWIRQRGDPKNSKCPEWFDHTLKFAHKGCVMAKELRINDSRYMIWLDGDAIMHKSPPSNWAEVLLDGNAISTQFEYNFKHDVWNWVHIESGIMVYDLAHPSIHKFVELFSDYYDNPEKLVTIRKPYDTYVAVASMKLAGTPVNNLTLVPRKITGKLEETFTNPLLNEYVSHYITSAKEKLKEKFKN